MTSILSTTPLSSSPSLQLEAKEDTMTEGLEDPIHIMWLVLAPIIFIVGLIGNILILIIMTNRRMSGTSTSVHLTMMATTDSIVLLVGLLPDWLGECDVFRLSDAHPIVCKLIKFLFYTAGDTSIWILVIFTVDRFVAICFPLRKVGGCCTVDRAKIYDVCALTLAVAKNIVVFWSRGVEYKPIDPTAVTTTFSTTPALPKTRYDDDSDPFFGYLAALTDESSINNTAPIPLVYDEFQELVVNKYCGYRPEFEYWIRFVRPWLVFVVVYLVPFGVIVLCNIFIVRALLKVRRDHIRKATSSTSSEKSMVQMTMMCLSASIAFLIFIGPSIFVLIGKPYWPTQERAYKDAKAINNLFVYINHSINFFLYCITGQRFRRMIWLVCRCKCRRKFDSSLDSLVDFRRVSVNGRRARARAYSDGMLLANTGQFNMHRATSALLVDAMAVKNPVDSAKDALARNGKVRARGSSETLMDDSPCGYRTLARNKQESVRDAVARGDFCREARESRKDGRLIYQQRGIRERSQDRPPPYEPPPPPPNEKPFPVSEIRLSPRLNTPRVSPINSPNSNRNYIVNNHIGLNSPPRYKNSGSPKVNSRCDRPTRLDIMDEDGELWGSQDKLYNSRNKVSPYREFSSSPRTPRTPKTPRNLPDIVIFKETTC